METPQDASLVQPSLIHKLTELADQTYEHEPVPDNFDLVVPGVYRSSYPCPEHFELLHKLNIKTVINLLDQYPDPYKRFVAAQDIRFIHTPVCGNKVTDHDMDVEKVRNMLQIISNTSFHPVLVHCRSGKHRTGCIVGCIRMLQGWPLRRACDEYVDYAFPKEREFDKQFIAAFDPKTVASVVNRYSLASWVINGFTDNPVVLSDAEAAENIAQLSIGSAVDSTGRDDGDEKMFKLPVSVTSIDEDNRTECSYKYSEADNEGAYSFVKNESSSVCSEGRDNDE